MIRGVASEDETGSNPRGSGNMATFIRAWLPACFAVLAASSFFGPGPSATAQERKEAGPGARKGKEVYNRVEVPTHIISIKPDGSRVEKGELVCELDAFTLREKMAVQEAATKEVETAYTKAKEAREAADL